MSAGVHPALMRRKYGRRRNMQVFIERPCLDLYPGVRVDKDTVLEYKNENVEQTVKDLVLHSVTKIKGEGYESTQDTTIYLKEGDILVYEEEGRGYIKPVKPFVTIKEAIEDYENIKDLGEREV
jgi:hypothetical protein